MDITKLLSAAVQATASDVHLKSGNYPMMRVDGKLRRIVERGRLDPATLDAMVTTILPEALRTPFARDHEVDFAYSIPGLGRFRCNVFRQRGTAAIALRLVPTRINSVAELGLPTVLTHIAEEERGLILLTGATGSGKSTTLAALIDHINHTRAAHIVMVEDPIEFLHSDNRSIISQRELGVDTHSFAQALRSALRQDPDVLLVGEMRDLDTIETGLIAAETGHLVLSTLHTSDATETINRLLAVFPTHQQRQVRLRLADILRAVVSQRLLPRSDGSGRCVAAEVMVNTPFICDCIRDPVRVKEIAEAIATGTSQYGMQTFDQSIYSLLEQGVISADVALRWASNPGELTLRMQGITSTADGARDEMAHAPANILNE